MEILERKEERGETGGGRAVMKRKHLVLLRALKLGKKAATKEFRQLL